MLRVQCEACSARYLVKPKHAGQTIRCPKCGAAVSVAADDAETPIEVTPVAVAGAPSSRIREPKSITPGVAALLAGVGVMVAAAAVWWYFLSSDPSPGESHKTVQRPDRPSDSANPGTKTPPSRREGPAPDPTEAPPEIKDDPEVSKLLVKADELRRQGKLEEAISVVKDLVERHGQRLKDHHPQIAEARQKLDRFERLRHNITRANELSERFEFPEAIVAAKRVFALERDFHGDDHAQVAKARAWVADLRRRWDRLRKKWQAQDAEVVKLLRQGKTAEATTALEGVLELQRQTLGGEHTIIGETLTGLARLKQDDPAASEALYRQALEVFTRFFGKDHWMVAEARLNLAEAQQRAKLEPSVRERLDGIWRRRTRINKEFDRQTLVNAANLIEADVRFLKQQLGEHHRLYAFKLNTLAGIHRKLGEYSQAEPRQRKAVEIRKALYGELHPYYIDVLFSQCKLYEQMGDYQKSLAIARQAAECCRKGVGDNHHKYAACLGYIASAHTAMGDLARAKPLRERAVWINQEELPESHIDRVIALQNLGSLYLRLGEYGDARRVLEGVLASIKKTGGENHPSYLAVLNNLARVDQRTGRFAQAEQRLLRVVEVSKQLYGKEHPQHARLVAALAAHYQLMGDDKRAEPLLRESLSALRRNMDMTFTVLSQRQQLSLTSMLRETLYGYLSSAVRLASDAEPPYGHLLAWKGAVFRSQRQARLAAGHPELRVLLAELQSISRMLSTTANAPPKPQDFAAWRKHIDELADKKERLESELSRRSAEFRRDTQQVTPEQLADSIPGGAALVDFLEYVNYLPHADGERRTLQRRLHLLAFVVRPSQPVVLVDLGPSDPIRDAGERWRAEIVRGGGGVEEGRGLRLKLPEPKKETPRRPPQFEVRRLLWAPLEEHLEGVTTLLISPDSFVARLPLAALPGRAEGKYLIEEQALVVVPVPRQLPHLLRDYGDRPSLASPSLLVVGGVDFASSAGEKQAVHPTAPVQRSALRHGGMEFSPLPGTKREAETIGKMYGKHFGGNRLKDLGGANATEDRFRELAPRHRFLHVATHGFFAPAAAEDTRSEEGRSGSSRAVREVHPGFLSGLALAGANRGHSAAGDSSTVTDDGIFTALEVASTDLTGVELAVLSACETGLGKTANGEGLLGLQRSFQIAGARSTITSLWKVDDTATETLMVEFYRNLWEKKLGKLESLRQAQMAMLQRYDPRKRALRPRGIKLLDKKQPSAQPKRLAPFYWAPFVLSGDWR